MQPKRTKYRKHQKIRTQSPSPSRGRGKKSHILLHCHSSGGIQGNQIMLHFGKYGIQSLESGRISEKTLEAMRRVMTRKWKRTGQLWMRVFPDLIVTEKPAEVRMGKGKGSPAFWIAKVQAGQILFEMDGISPNQARAAAQLADHKLGMKTQFITVDS